MTKWKREEGGSEGRKKAKRMRVDGGGGDGEKTLKKLRIKRIIWKINGNVEGISKLYDEEERGSRTAKRRRTGAATIVVGSCSHRSGPSVSNNNSTSTSSAVVNEQRRQPRRVASLPMEARVNDPVCVMRKRITQSDIQRQQHRLLLPIKQLNRPMLQGMMTAAEKMRTTEKSGLPINILDRAGREYSLTLKFLASIKAYRVMGADYMKLVEDNRIRTGHFLHLWVYRVGQRGSGDGIANETGELRMAVINYAKAEGDEEEEDDDDDQECALADEAGNAGGSVSDGLPPELSDEEMEAAAALVSLSHGDGDDEREAARTLVWMSQRGFHSDIVVVECKDSIHYTSCILEH
ncbi:hypothetical protein OPV22_020302 [Ensete ventricosum]|uniref:TF-B3 domain-containing protein n=1 Tax=Ensete ventricosum TaxID=4639 RepID=A0AAV8QMQ8_ENSVE|nr:hypothetical protein OPV22_020302 [Ensete ventricosum]